MTEEKASTELSTLLQKKEDVFYTYYRQTETLLIEIFRKNRVTHNGKNWIILNNAVQHILKDTIAKFGFSLKISKLHLHMIEYRADPIRNVSEGFKKAKAYLDVLNIKA